MEQEQRRLLERKLQTTERELVDLESERKRIKWFFVAALVLWPIGLKWSAWISAVITFAFLCFFFVGLYISYFHRKECKRRIEDLQAKLRN